MSTTPHLKVPSLMVGFNEDEIARVLRDAEEILRSGRLILGPFTEKFEAEFARAVGTEHAVAVNSGTTALEVVLRAIEVCGREVLVPSNTNFASAAAAVYAGGKVVLYDGGLYPDWEDVRRKITSKTAALIVVHIGGYLSPELNEMVEYCRERNVFFLEDAAHAHHASLKGARAGSFGDAGAFSFFPTKVMTTGEGGMITTDDGELAEKARMYRDQGKDSTGLYHRVMGNSWRVTEIGASMGLAQLASLDRDTAYRQKVIRLYEAELGESSVFDFPDTDPEMKPSGYKCVVVLRPSQDRKSLEETLTARGVQLGRPVYELPLHKQPVFQPVSSGNYPVCEDFCNRHTCLPLWRSISSEQQTAVIEAIQSLG